MILRLGVIGAGLKAADYARGWAQMSDVEIVAAADVVPGSRERLAKVLETAKRAKPSGI